MIVPWPYELWLDTPMGRGLVLLCIDRGANADLEWTVVIEATGEIWSWKNYDVKVCQNRTMGIRK
jgi:hypothetical protein